MNFALSDDHIMLRDSAQAFVDREISLDKLLVPGATVADAGYPENWRRIQALGWPGMIIPEEHGGSGLDCIELSVLVTEMGRTLLPCPFAGHTFGVWALMKAGSEDQRSRLLGEAAAGSVVFALLPPINGGAVRSEGRLLNGEHGFVIDAPSARWLIVAAADNHGAHAFYLVDAAQRGVTIHPQPWRDVTRQVGRVVLTEAQAEPLPGEFGSSWGWVRDRICCFLASENVGGLRHVLSESVAYANERVAFGRPIGAFQAIKHPLAEMLGAVEGSNTAVLYAAWALAQEKPKASMYASLAKAYSSDAYVAATHKSIQIFGAIGFTWEMKNHLYFKRARANAELFGNARAHRDHVINMATDHVWSEPF